MRRVGRAHEACERALTDFEATLLLPSAVDYARMIEAVECLSGEYYRASERLKLRDGGARGVSVETLWVARLQMFSCVWLAEMNARFPGKVGGFACCRWPVVAGRKECEPYWPHSVG